MKPNVLVVTGPTASGKSAYALNLAEEFNGEIINADSVSVYKDFNIGSSTPPESELSRVKHHLVSSLDPVEEFSAGNFRDTAAGLIEEITSSDKLPIVVGGTGLYISALLGGLISVGEISSDARQRLKEVEKNLSQEELSSSLYQLLAEQDSSAAESIHTNDILRIRRALLISWSTGKSVSELREKHEYQEQNYRALVISILPEREALYHRINQRVDQMFEQGLLEEVKSLREKYVESSPGFRSIGYRHVLQYLNQELSFDDAVELMKRDTRRFAKRQFTWWRHQPTKLGWKAVSVENAAQAFLERNSEFEGDEVYWFCQNQLIS